MTQQVIIPIASRGLATSFAEAEVPTDFATEFLNRFINGSGDAEKRQGIKQEGLTVPSSPNITGLHEYITQSGDSIKFASGNGIIWRYDNPGWTQVFQFTNNTRIRSVQMDTRILFFNGVEPTYWTDDGTEFTQLKPLIEVGRATITSANTVLRDVDISAWSLQTNVVNNDIVFYPSQNTYALVVGVSGNTLTTTPPFGTNDGFANSVSAPLNGARYEILDNIELNIFPVPGDSIKDNIATAISGTTSNTIIVSGISDWTKTEAFVGDIVYNATRNRGSFITGISNNSITIQPISAQTVGDSLTFLKSAAPIMHNAAVHFGRLYAIDARDKRKIRISGATNPLDWTNDSATLDTNNFSTQNQNVYNAGSLNSEGEQYLSINSFQSYLILGGTKNIFAFVGTTPFGEGADLQPVVVLPAGLKSKDSLVNLGNDIAWISDAGIQLWSFTDQNAVLLQPISEQINTTIRDIIKNSNPDDLQMFQYPRRSWLITKLGSDMYVWNFAPITLARRSDTRGVKIPSWFKFEGGFANQAAFKIMSDGDLWVGGAGGVVSRFDQDTYDDNGVLYPTRYETGWLHMDARRSTNIKTHKFLEPYLEAGQEITYEISVAGDWDQTSEDSVLLTSRPAGAPIGTFEVGASIIGGSRVTNPKVPLRARGIAFKYRFETEDNKGPDIISRYVAHIVRAGTR